MSVLPLGRKFTEDYLIVKLLGEGGMGAVYEAIQTGTNRHRALKVLLPHCAADRAMRERFEQEARIGSLIDSEHIVEVVAAGVDVPTRMPWLAMELLPGVDLRRAMENRKRPMTPTEVLGLFAQLCHAVGAAHRANVVHRDLKPENLFLAESRRVETPVTLKVLDFGIARLLRGATLHKSAPVGSCLWMAPEQASVNPISPATDIWAMGLIAFFLLTGREFWKSAHQHDANQLQILNEVILAPIPSATQRALELEVGGLLPPGFNAWFSRCVCRDPSARWHSVDELFASLRAVLSKPPIGSENKRELAAFADTMLLQKSAVASRQTSDQTRGVRAVSLLPPVEASFHSATSARATSLRPNGQKRSPAPEASPLRVQRVRRVGVRPSPSKPVFWRTPVFTINAMIVVVTILAYFGPEPAVGSSAQHDASAAPRFRTRNGTTFDAQTGLTWQMSLPAWYSNCERRNRCTWEEAKAYCAQLQLVGHGWRLPSASDLTSLLMDGVLPKIDQQAFPNTPQDAFWTSSPSTKVKNEGICVSFINGYADSTPLHNVASVRCVR